MTCSQKEIKELLPGYAEGTLEPAAKQRVEAHLASCADCGAEADLLRMLSAEAVPDPGDAFWQAMPSRIHHDVEKETSKPRPWSLREILTGGRFVPRWAWSAAALLLVASVTWFIFRPMPDEKAPALATIGSEYEYDLPGLSTGIDLAELDRAEMKQVSSWADRKLTEVGESLRTAWVNGQEADMTEYDEFWEMDRAELERFSELLKGAMQEV